MDDGSWNPSHQAFISATVILVLTDETKFDTAALRYHNETPEYSGLVAIIGSIGNGLVVTVVTILRRRGHKSNVQLFLLHLAISDLMVCLMCIPLTLFSNFHYPTKYSSIENGACKFSRFVQYLTPTVSISLLATISIDRYMSLARPMASIALRPKLLTPSWMIVLAWLYSIMQFTPTFYFTDVKPITVEENKTVYYCTTVPNNSLSGLAYLMFLAVVSFVLPLVTMSIMYYKVSRVVWRRQRNLSTSSTISANTAHLSVLIQSRRRVIRVLLTVVLVFLICWSPFVIYCGFLEKTLRGFPNPMDGTRLALYGLGLLNSMCNSFIYFFNVGRKRTDALKDLYLQIYTENKSRRSSTNSQGGERKSPRKLQQFRLKTMDREHSVKNKLKKNSEKNRNKITDFQIRESMEELWQPFSVWPPIGDLRESVVAFS